MKPECFREPDYTDWYPPYMKPVHIGLYQRLSLFGAVHWSWWDGKKFGMGSRDKGEALRAAGTTSPNNFHWRGLTALSVVRLMG